MPEVAANPRWWTRLHCWHGCLLYGRYQRVQTDSALDHPRTVYHIDFDEYAEELVAKLSDAWQLAYTNVRRAQAKQKV